MPKSFRGCGCSATAGSGGGPSIKLMLVHVAGASSGSSTEEEDQASTGANMPTLTTSTPFLWNFAILASVPASWILLLSKLWEWVCRLYRGTIRPLRLEELVSDPDTSDAEDMLVLRFRGVSNPAGGMYCIWRFSG